VEPATVYLITVFGAASLWIVGDAVWAVALWATRWDGVVASVLAKAVAIATAVLVLGASWRAPAAVADVVPPTHRVIEVDVVNATPAASVVTFITMVEGGRPISASYTVRGGDCLWRIARSVIVTDGDDPTGAMIAAFWRRIYEANSDVIGANPRLIFPGQVLVIPER
jgi:nucleoid-associated protein YgaU